MSSRKGRKASKNAPLFYEEVKTKHSIMMTPIAWDLLQKHAQEHGVSVSEFLERWIRKELDDQISDSQHRDR